MPDFDLNLPVEMVATLLSECKPNDGDVDRMAQWTVVVRRFADCLSGLYPQFATRKFLVLCGVDPSA